MNGRTNVWGHVHAGAVRLSMIPIYEYHDRLIRQDVREIGSPHFTGVILLEGSPWRVGTDKADAMQHTGHAPSVWHAAGVAHLIRWYW